MAGVELNVSPLRFQGIPRPGSTEICRARGGALSVPSAGGRWGDHGATEVWLYPSFPKGVST